MAQGIKEPFFRRNPKVAFRFLKKECVLYTTFDNKFHQLNEIGTKIWKLCVGWTSLNKIVSSICKEYDIRRKKAENDITYFLIKMNKAKLLFIKDNDKKY